MSDPTRTLASPQCFVAREKDPRHHRQALAALAREWEVTTIVVGLPVSMDGSERDAAVISRDEAVAIGEACGLPVEVCDERLTTVEAARRLGAGGRNTRSARGVIDASAAAVMLQSWIDGSAHGR